MPNVGDRVYAVRFDLSNWEDGMRLITRRKVVRANASLGHIYVEARGGNEDCLVKWHSTPEGAKQEVLRHIEYERTTLNAIEDCVNKIQEKL